MMTCWPVIVPFGEVVSSTLAPRPMMSTSGHRGIELHRNAFGELGEQRAVALAAERGDVALARPAQIRSRDFAEVLAC